ncbi:MAG: hypothetical protein K0U13_01415, partial [Chlamydiae bacterium]|nr:hypothetical protein [Chlamydiota bacterium]
LSTLLVILSSGACYALPVGNPAAASLLCDGILWEGHCGDACDPNLTICDAFSIRYGFWGNYQFNRYMYVEDREPKRDLDVVRVSSNAFYAAFNFWDRFDIFGTFGGTKIQAWGDSGIWQQGIDNTQITGTGQSLFHFQTTTGLSWSVGGRATVWECGCTSIGVEGQYFQVRPMFTFYDEYNNNSAQGVTERMRQAFGNGYTVKYYDWQVGLGIAHRINMLVPYAAIRWSGAALMTGKPQLVSSGLTDFGVANGVDLGNVKSQKTTGYAVGVSLTDCQKMALTVEADFASSLEMSIIADFRW